jgi:hypothetical protein
LEKIYRANANALKVRLYRARQRVLRAFESERQNAPKDRTLDHGDARI